MRNSSLAVSGLLALSLVLLLASLKLSPGSSVGRILLLAACGMTGVALVAALLTGRSSGDNSGTAPVQASSNGAVAVDELPLSALWFDSQSRIVAVNPAFQETFGFREQDTFLSQLWHPDEFEKDRMVLNTGSLQQAERRLFRADGQMLWCEVTLDRSTKPARLLIADVTRRKVAEAELEQARASIHDLYEVIAATDNDLSQKIRSLLALGCRRFSVETGYLGQVHEDRLKVLQIVSPDDRIRVGQVYDLGAPAGKGAPTKTALQHPKGPRGLVHANFPSGLIDFPFFASTERETYLGAPVFVNGAMYGMLNFSDPEPRAEPFSEEDTEFLQLMVQWLAGEIERRQARQELEKQQAQLLAVNQKLESLAVHDGLTGAKNRRAFDEQLEAEFRRARRYGTPLSLLLLDVDKFKQYNDTYGHPAGDEVLKKVAQVLQAGVRNIDFLARYGGEEFVILLPNTDMEGARILAERLRFRLEAQEWKLREVTASFGAATLTGKMADPALLTAAADGALYHSKANGRNRVTHAQDLPADAGQPAPHG